MGREYIAHRLFKESLIKLIVYEVFMRDLDKFFSPVASEANTH